MVSLHTMKKIAAGHYEYRGYTLISRKRKTWAILDTVSKWVCTIAAARRVIDRELDRTVRS